MNLLRNTDANTPTGDVARELSDDRAIANILLCILSIVTKDPKYTTLYDRTVQFYANGFINETLNETDYNTINKRIVEL